MNHTYLDKQVDIYYIDTKTVKSCENLHLEELFKKELELFEPDANNSSYLLCKTLRASDPWPDFFTVIFMTLTYLTL